MDWVAEIVKGEIIGLSNLLVFSHNLHAFNLLPGHQTGDWVQLVNLLHVKLVGYKPGYKRKMLKAMVRRALDMNWDENYVEVHLQQTGNWMQLDNYYFVVGPYMCIASAVAGVVVAVVVAAFSADDEMSIAHLYDIHHA